MNPKDYVKNVLVTEARDMAPLVERFSQTRNIRLLHGAIGLASEIAEIVEMSRNEEIDVVNLKEEMGDLFWYMGIMIDELQLDPENLIRSSAINAPSKPENQIRDLKEEMEVMAMCVGTAIDFLKKSVMYGKALNVLEIEGQLQELGFAIEAALNIYGMTSSQACERNIEKLKARYGEKFTEAAALERNLAVEREILEKK